MAWERLRCPKCGNEDKFLMVISMTYKSDGHGVVTDEIPVEETKWYVCDVCGNESLRTC